MTEDLSGRVAIVTGAASGIGPHFAQALAKAGAKVAIGDIADGTSVAEAINKSLNSESAMYAPLDVSDEKSVREFCAAVGERFGAADILINNAAVASVLKPQDVESIDTELWNHVMAVNVRGPFLMARAVIPAMRKSGYGKIVNISSGVAYRGMAKIAHYVTSKAAVVGLTRALAQELGEDGICVNTLAPGMVLSEGILANEEMVAQGRASTQKMRAIPREAIPTDLVGTLLFLTGPASDYITGQTIAADGGILKL